MPWPFLLFSYNCSIANTGSLPAASTNSSIRAVTSLAVAGLFAFSRVDAVGSFLASATTSLIKSGTGLTGSGPIGCPCSLTKGSTAEGVG